MKAGTIFTLSFLIVSALVLVWIKWWNVLVQTKPFHQPVMDSIEHGRTYQLRCLQTGITVRKVHITNSKGDIIASYYETPVVEDSLLLDHSKIP